MKTYLNQHLLTLLLFLFFLPVLGQTTLFDYGSSWSYYDNQNEPAVQGSTDWNDVTYDDSSWATGNAHFGYGDGDEVTVINSNTLTAYVRHSFNVANPSIYSSLNLNLTFDDGAVVYLNGVEVWRINMPGGTISYGTFSSSVGTENGTASNIISDALLTGTNVLAVEIHQASSTSSDISFDFKLSANAAGQVSVVRGPYLQKGTPNSVVIKWRTLTPTESVVNYGTVLGNLNQVNSDNTPKLEHEVEVIGLAANTTYYYEIANASTVLIPETSDLSFKTHPISGNSQAYTFWALGDAGTANNNQRAVRDAYYNYIGNNTTDGILFLGDNAYNDGTDAEYQGALFENMYEDKLKNTISWSCLGNHDGHSADSNSQTGPYYDIFTFPKNGESGGLASGTEAYYSWDYGNIHFIALDSYETDRSVGGSMYDWALSDIQSTTQEWIIAYWHHPPYTKGSHNSDTESELIDMRQNFLPMLENNGVDLILSGHSHSYERSYFLNGHYGISDTFNSVSNTIGANGSGDGRSDGTGSYTKEISGPDAGKGAVYITAGSSGKVSAGTLDHEAMYYSVSQLGSCIVEVDGSILTVKFIRETGAIEDYFSIEKGCSTIGLPCDDGNACTTNDVYDSNCNCAGTLTVDTATGDIETYVGNIIDSVPGSTGDNYVVPNASQETSWNTVIDFILANDLANARLNACDLNYQVTEFTDTSISPSQVFYVLEEKSPQQNYWGTYVFSKTPVRENLVIMAPHSKFDTNTGKEALHCFKNNVARAVFINGTHRCNNSIYSTCSGTTTACGSSEAYRVSDLAHNTNSMFQKTTENVFNNVSNSVFIQLHGFAKQASDPYVIMSNGTRVTPSPDYATLIQNALLVEDNTLTFELAHINTSWTRLIGFTNTQGRLINNSADYCNTSATATSGRFIHIEQEKTKLRDDITGWTKMSNALSNVFAANCVADSDGDGVCDADDICPGFDDLLDSDGDTIPDGCDTCDNNLIGTPCDDGDACTINDVYDANCGCAGTFEDTDSDGVCDANDQCPGFDDTIDTNNNGIPDNCEDVCTGYTASFIDNPLTHSGSGSNSTILSFPADSQDILFTISSINEKLNGKASNKYIEHVEVSYVNEFNVSMNYGTYSGSNTSSIIIDIQGKVQSVTISLSDELSGNTTANMNISFSDVTYCINSTPCTPDSDGDGVCDAEDQCPGVNDALIGTPCDDGDACTTGEIYDTNCGCSGGIYTDNDGDGFCIGDDPDDNDGCNPDPNSGACSPCSDIISDSFESGFGNWNDGGKDCNQSTSNPNTGNYSIQLRDNSGESSSMFTNNMNMSAYSELTVEFSFYTSGMDSGKSFLLEVSTNGGALYNVYKTWVSGTDFNDATRYNESVLITGIPFTSTTRFRFRCDASNKGDQVYLDDVVITDCISQPLAKTFPSSVKKESKVTSLKTIKIYPNPASHTLFIAYSDKEVLEANIAIYNLNGQLVRDVKFNVDNAVQKIDLKGLSQGLYLLRMVDDKGKQLTTKRIVLK